MSDHVSDPFDLKWHASLWIEDTARSLYECERAEHPERNLSTWDVALPVMRADASYRAMAAHQRSKATVKAVLVERIAMTLALVDGFIWPACESPIRPQLISDEHYAAICAERRQLYRHRARLVITATNNYLDVNAAGEPEEQRQAVIQRAKAQQLADVHAVQTWRAVRFIKRAVPISVPITTAFPADARD